MSEDGAREIDRLVAFETGEVTCRCGEKLYLWFNGAELDANQCKCGIFYRTEMTGCELVTYEKFPDHGPPGYFTIWRLRLIFWEDWSQFFDKSRYNWIDMNVLRLQWECAPYKKTIEVGMGLIGFNLCVEWYFGNE